MAEQWALIEELRASDPEPRGAHERAVSWAREWEARVRQLMGFTMIG